VCLAVVNLRTNLFGPGQAYVTLSQVWSLNGLRLDELDEGKLTNEDTTPTRRDALEKMERLRSLAKFNKN
jgi:hypothetical protein